MKAEHRAYLEAIIDSDDPTVRPGDRLKAIELLGEVEDPESEQVADLDHDELDRQLDSFMSLLIQEVQATEEGRKRYPLRCPRHPELACHARSQACDGCCTR